MPLPNSDQYFALIYYPPGHPMPFTAAQLRALPPASSFLQLADIQAHAAYIQTLASGKS